MTTREVQFTPSEAAFVAGLSEREVQKAFDQRWFDLAPRRQIRGITRRSLGPAELVHLRLVKDVSGYAVFQTEAKRLIHRQLRERVPRIVVDPDKNRMTELRSYFEKFAERLKEPVRVSRLFVDVATAWAEMTDRLTNTVAAQFAVVEDPEIRSGEPVVRGTRIPVHLLQDLKQQGATDRELLADYPSLDEERLGLALLYARIHPRAGRPRKRPWQLPAAQ